MQSAQLTDLMLCVFHICGFLCPHLCAPQIHHMSSCNFTSVDLMAALSTSVATVSSHELRY